eukprot:scaffold29084_cov60-Phaeocystis_antarctica.AAC.4
MWGIEGLLAATTPSVIRTPTPKTNPNPNPNQAAFSLPLLPELARSADTGVPLVVSQPDGDASRAYAQLADAVIRELDALRAVAKPTCMYSSEQQQVLVLLPGGGIQTIDSYALRRLCRSPSNRPDDLPPNLAPLEFAPLGNYAMSVRWSDGHQSLLPYRSFVEGWEPYGPGD